MDTENPSNMSESLDAVVDLIKLIEYPAISTSEDLHVAIEAGLKDKQYNNLIQFLTTELRALLNMDEDVNCATSLEDYTAFVMIISSFLRELNCPHESLTGGILTARLTKYSDKLLLVKYLVDQLMLARFLQEKVPEKKLELKLQETRESSDMRQILQTLRFPKPPANITSTQLFDKIVATIPLVIKKAGGVDLVGDGLFKGSLSDKQWELLKDIDSDLHKEYTLRREMMLMRLDVTIQSFQWSDKIKGKEVDFESHYFDQRRMLKPESNLDISDLFAARTDLAIHEKISSTSVRKNTKTPLNKVIIGQVPDRGGRCSELKAPPPDMPAWSGRNQTSGDFSRGGGRGNPRGGRESRGGRGGGGYEGRGGRGGRGSGSYESRGGGSHESRSSGGYEGRGGSEYEGRGGEYEAVGGYEGRGRGGYRKHQSGYQGRNSGITDDSQRRYGGNHYGGREESGSYDRYGGASYSGYGNDSYNSTRRDSDGSIEDYQQNKRPRTYDNFRSDRTTYAEQYVQENQHNQQYHRGGGRDNYHRGRGNYRGGGYR
ncbi:unnamed protein product [Ceutorhynchus assimilis]|uniref:Protein FAM98A n=1 Tax=Ceutorhynchus assimilis TaxID=467358 RepID=A0A9N9MBH4_9CUCU|nr:unnamed protein product [Ceutorhynchus assimilis]